MQGLEHRACRLCVWGMYGVAEYIRDIRFEVIENEQNM